jgi:DNA primase
MALERAGFPNAIGFIGSEVTPERLLKIQRYRRVLVATDPDQAGDKAWRRVRDIEMTNRLNASGRVVTRVQLTHAPDDMPEVELVSALHKL